MSFLRLRVLLGLWLLAAVASPASAQLFGDDEEGLLGGETSAEPDRDPTRVDVSVTASAVDGQGRFVLAVVLDHPPKLHSWPSVEQDVLPPALTELTTATRTRITPSGDGVEFGEIQWPDPHPSTVPNLDFSEGAPPTTTAPTYAGRAIAFVPGHVTGDAGASGPLDVSVEVFYQACDDRVCYAPVAEVVSATVSRGEMQLTGDFAGFEAERLDRVGETEAATAAGEADEEAANEQEEIATESAIEEDAADAGTGQKFLGVIDVPSPGTPAGLALIGLLAAAGGFVLNLTPCVLPVIPLKIMSLSQHAGSPGKSFYLGLWMAIGVVAFWALLSIPVLAFQQFADPSRVFGIWWVTAGLGLMMGVMAAGLMGAFELTLPQSVYKINPKADSAHGSFLFGVMTAVFGLPCFGLIVGPLLAASATTTPALVVTIFTAIGVGMAAPYLLLSIRPELLKAVPKAGPGSSLVKQVMGLLLLAAGAYFVGSGVLGLLASEPYLGKVLHWWVVAAFLCLAGLWLVVRIVKISKKPVAWSGFSLLATVFAAGGIWTANNQTAQQREEYAERKAAEEERDAAVRQALTDLSERLKVALAGGGGDGNVNVPAVSTLLTSVWNDYSPAALEEAMGSGKVVVVDFTAEWCLNCKALEATVLNKGKVREALKGEDTIAIKVDLTADDAPGWAYLGDLGRTGIPTLAIYGPGLSEPWISTAYTPGQVLDAIEAARGQSVAVR